MGTYTKKIYADQILPNESIKLETTVVNSKLDHEDVPTYFRAFHQLSKSRQNRTFCRATSRQPFTSSHLATMTYTTMVNFAIGGV